MNASFSTCDLCDAHELDTSGDFRVLPAVFRDYGRHAPFGGPVATVRCHEDNARVKQAVQSPGTIETPRGRVARVLVVTGGASLARALVGGNLAAAAAQNGWAGLVVDGAVRDALELAAAGIAVKALGLTPLRSVKRGEGQGGEPVQVQGVWVRPGDWLYADADGIVIASRQLVF